MLLQIKLIDEQGSGRLEADFYRLYRGVPLNQHRFNPCVVERIGVLCHFLDLGEAVIAVVAGSVDIHFVGHADSTLCAVEKSNEQASGGCRAKIDGNLVVACLESLPCSIFGILIACDAVGEE